MAKTQIRLEGVEEVMSRINAELAGIKQKSYKGLINVAIMIRSDMESTSPKIPVDTGNLRHSWFATTAKVDDSFRSRFVGDKSGQMSSEHKETTQEAKAITSAAKYPTMLMGFTAYYSAPVHEMINADFVSPRKKGKKMVARRAGAGAKFFESALFRNQAKIITILKNEVELK